MDALRLYTSRGTAWHVPAATGLAEKVRTACFDHTTNRWRIPLAPEHIESVAYAFYLKAQTGSTAEANRFARDHGVIYRTDPATGRLTAIRLPAPARSR
jgi:hypothetical protein